MANDVFGKLEARLKAVVDALSLTGVSVNTASTAETLEPPAVFCAARDTVGEVELDANVWEINCAIVVTTNADDETLAEHRTRVAAVFDGFRQSDIASTISDETEGIYCYQVREPSFESEQIEREWVDALTFVAVVTPKHLAA